MNIQFQRAVDRWVGVPVCALLSWLERLRPSRAPAATPRRILVILLSEMGSLVLGHSMFATLRQRYPQAELHVLLFAKNREVLDLMGVVPPENVITIRDKGLSQFVGDILRAITRLRALRFDVVIDCELFARVSAIFSWLTAAPVRIGFHRHTQEGLYRGSLMTRPVMYNPYRHLSQQFLAMVQAIEAPATLADGQPCVPLAKHVSLPAPDDTPQLAFAPGEVEAVAEYLHRDFPALLDANGTQKPLVLVYPSGGILPIRAWPFENYQQLCRELLAQGYAVGVIGLPSDKALGQALVTHCQDAACIDLTGYTKTVRHLLALFHRADLLITNDGGPGQFAVQTPISSIIFFGPETPQLYRPLSPRTFCFYLPMSCSPCLTAYNHRNSPCDGDNQCLKQIAPAEVLSKAQEMLAARRPDRESSCAA